MLLVLSKFMVPYFRFRRLKIEKVKCTIWYKFGA